MKFFQGLFFILLFSVIAWWTKDQHAIWKEEFIHLINARPCPIIEAKFTPEQIMEINKKSLLRLYKYQYLPPVIKLYPLLLLDIKYNLSPTKTEEGLILWDLIDGEMIVNTKDWKKTHGLSDCIRENSSRSEIKILLTLAKHKGNLHCDSLLKLLGWDTSTFGAWIESCRRKNLVTQHENTVRIHMQDPLLTIIPKTIFHENLITIMDESGLARLSKRFSPSQIKRMASLIFEEEGFSIRNMKQIFLPIYIITVQNPNNSLQTTYWNSFTAQQIIEHAFIQ